MTWLRKFKVHDFIQIFFMLCGFVFVMEYLRLLISNDDYVFMGGPGGQLFWCALMSVFFYYQARRQRGNKAFAELLSHERSLHDYDIRTNAKKLKKMLHPSFVEVGFSGKSYSYDEITKALLEETYSGHEIWSEGFEFREIDQNTMQLFYKSARQDESGQLSQYAKRTSIWRLKWGKWQMIFHQATPIAPFEKSDEEL